MNLNLTQIRIEWRDILLLEIFPRIASVKDQVAFLTAFGFTYTQLGKYNKALLDGLFYSFFWYTFPATNPVWLSANFPNLVAKVQDGYRLDFNAIEKKYLDLESTVKICNVIGLRFIEAAIRNIRCPLSLFVFMRTYRTFFDDRKVLYDQIKKLEAPSKYFYDMGIVCQTLEYPDADFEPSHLERWPKMPVALEGADNLHYSCSKKIEYTILDALVYSETVHNWPKYYQYYPLENNGKVAFDRIREKFSSNPAFYTKMLIQSGNFSGCDAFWENYNEIVSIPEIARALGSDPFLSNENLDSDADTNTNTKKIKREDEDEDEDNSK